jgi:hypothetical protein
MVPIVDAIEGSIKALFIKSPWTVLLLFAISGGGFGTLIQSIAPIRAGAHTASMDKKIMDDHRIWEEEHFAPFWITENRFEKLEHQCEETKEKLKVLELWKNEHAKYHYERVIELNKSIESIRSCCK